MNADTAKEREKSSNFQSILSTDVTLLLLSKHSNVMMTNFQTWIVELFNAPQNFHNWYDTEWEWDGEWVRQAHGNFTHEFAHYFG